MSKRLSKMVREIGLSPTLRISGLAGELRAAGEDVLDFAAGQPDFPTPESVKAAGVRAIETNQTRYTANQGILELRTAIAEHLADERRTQYSPEQILVSPGAKASLYFAVLTLFDHGDEVIVPRPYWVTYPEQVRMSGATPVFVDGVEADGFKLTAETLAKSITPATRGVLLNYPSNPTGACLSADELRPIADLCVERGIWMVADEIYSRLMFDRRKFTSVAALGDAAREWTIVIDGMSKAWSMTGWRIGFAAGPTDVIAAMSRLQSHSTSNATSISQWASVAALEVDAAELERRCAAFQERRDRIVAGLRERPGVTCVMPEGAFYAFPNVSGCLGDRHATSADLAEYLLREARVALVPGEAFGAPGHLRITYAVSLDRIEEGLERLARARG